MFLKKLLAQNRAFVDAAFFFHKTGALEPDTYLLDTDRFLENARVISQRAEELSIRLYLMTKQFGRNPELARRILELPSFSGVVAVDFREAEVMARAGLPLGNVGHIVQPPMGFLRRLISWKPEIVTLFSLEMAEAAGRAAAETGWIQPVMMRVYNNEEAFFLQQKGGFFVGELLENAERIREIPGIVLAGVTGFPALLYDPEKQEVVRTDHFRAVVQAAKMLREAGFGITQVNLPSLNHDGTLEIVADGGGTHAEPGHGISGTTPDRAAADAPGVPTILYLSEISHRMGGASFCYGGGHYVRSCMEEAFVGGRRVPVRCSSEAIDYYMELDGEHPVGAPVVASFRSQIFVTRSRVALLEGAARGKPRIAGIYTAQGERVS